MTPELRVLPLDDARRAIAALVVGGRGAAEGAVGGIELWPHQRDAVTRLRAAIAEFGGALLADDVGTGKTFVALAVASRHASPLVVAPATLRDSWRTAGERSGRAVHFVSFESLSRGRQPSSGHDFVIVDEAHHARNPNAKRYGALADLVAGVPVLLLTATPIHNHRGDLGALLALFLGASAATLDDAALARCVVRRGRGVLGGAAPIPAVHGPIPLASDSTDDATPEAILSLPPPLPAADAGTAGALLTITLLRQWASSQGALLAAIRRRLASAHALASTLDGGRYPTRAELSAWTLGDDAQQVVMSELFAPVAHQVPAAELRGTVAAHIDGLRTLRRVAAADPGIDRRRARRLREAWHAHPGARSIAFTQFAETVDAYWRELRDQPGTCALTAAGGRVAGGSVSRAEALGSFAPGGGRIDPARRIDALVVTDLASEGLDLQEASVLVHLDLPWTPARLEQRVGRIVRPGSPHEIVHVYAMVPPVQAAALLDIRRRLETKLAAARAAFGEVMPDIGLEAITVAEERPSGQATIASSPRLRLAAPATAAEEIERLLRQWSGIPVREIEGGESGDDGIILSIVRAEVAGWLAVVGIVRPRLVAAIGDAVSDEPALVAELCARVDAASCVAASDDDVGSKAASVTAALHQLTAWLDASRAASLAGVPDIPIVRGRRRALSTIARIATAPASARIVAAPTASRALSVASGPLAVSFERDISAARADTELLTALAALPRLYRPEAADFHERARVLIVLSPDR